VGADLGQLTPLILEEMVARALLIKKIIHLEIAQQVVEAPVAAALQVVQWVPLMEMAEEEEEAALVRQGVMVPSPVVEAAVEVLP